MYLVCEEEEVVVAEPVLGRDAAEAVLVLLPVLLEAGRPVLPPLQNKTSYLVVINIYYMY